MSLFIALLAIAPLSALIIGGSQARRGLIVTTLVAGSCVILLELWFEAVDPGDIVTMVVFQLLVMPLVCGIVAGVAATLSVGARRAFGLPIIAGIVGALVGILLGMFARPADLEDLWLTIFFASPLFVVSSAFAVTAAVLGGRRT